ncbi:MAG TPA: c-type cytochrome [Beijerinckiaceae bacterium]|jgi:cytochrome c
MLMSPVRHVAAVALALTSSAAFGSVELSRSKNCVACHHPERKLIGPSYKAVAERYANDDDAATALSEKVIKGGGGVWGPSPMPPQPHVSKTEAEALVKWILSHK